MPGRGGKPTVAELRRYKVILLRQAKEIARTYLKEELANLKEGSDWVFGLGEVDAPSPKMGEDGYILKVPTGNAAKKHRWVIQIRSPKTQLRVGQVVVEAYTGEVLVAQTTSNSVIESQLEFHKDEDNFKGRYLPAKKSKKHRETMRRSPHRNMIIKGDSKELRKLGEETIDLIFFSPPYYSARPDYYDYNGYQDYLDLLKEVIEACKYVLHEGRFIVVNVSPVIEKRRDRKSSSTRYPVHIDVGRILAEAGFDFIEDIRWVKPQGAAGHRGRRFKADRNPMQYKAVPHTENVLVFRKRSTLLIDWFIRNHHNPEIVQRSKIPDGYQETELWKIHPANDPVHPAIFPVELAQEVIRNYSFEDDVVLDPFGGIGTTAEAAVRLGRRFIMVDLDQDPDKKKEKSYIETMWERADTKWGADKEEIDLHKSWDTVEPPDGEE